MAVVTIDGYRSKFRLFVFLDATGYYVKLSDMKYIASALLLVIIVTVTPITALAASWPKLTFGNGVAQCNEALRVATASFRSTSSELGLPLEIPEDLEAIDLTNYSSFERISRPYIPVSGEDSFREIFWGKFDVFGFRIVVRIDPSGWQYEVASLYVINATVSSDDFIADIRKLDRTGSSFSPVIDGRKDLLVFKSRQGNSLWVADIGQLHDFLPAWRIYVADVKGAEHKCTVEFRPKVKVASSLLPKSVRVFARLLDQTIGSGNDEGSLNQTLRLRTKVSRSLTNAALRPWALDEPYNSRRQVEEGLSAWSSQSDMNLVHYDRIQKQYPIAQQSLAKYYESDLHFSTDEAHTLAAKVLDILFRTHYMFHSE